MGLFTAWRRTRSVMRTYNDVNAVRRGRVSRRVGRRLYGKATGRLARKLFG